MNCYKIYSCLVQLVAFSLLQRSTLAALPNAFSLTINIELTNPSNTGACLSGYLGAIGACSIFCSSQIWCVYFIFGPCDHIAPNRCWCMVCHQQPPLSQIDGGRAVLGESKMRKPGTAKRLVDKEKSSGAVILSWSSVSENCILATGSISPTLSPWPVNIFRVIDISDDTIFYAEPACPDNFVARGVTYCRSDEGIWWDTANLACFAADCYQEYAGKHYYAGSLRNSMYGHPCWYWNVQGSVSNNFYNSIYHFDNFDRDQAENFCRSFLDDDYVGVWCYNANYGSDGGRWYACDVPACPAIY